MGKSEAPEIGVTFKEAPPKSIDAAAELGFAVELGWPEGFGPDGASYVIRDCEKIIQQGALPQPSSDDGSVNFTLRAPGDIGTHRWTLIVSAENKKRERAEGSLPLLLTTVPHETSLAVWDNPSPVVRGAKFDVKVGAKCTSSCGIGGRTVEIRDEAGTVIGSAALGDSTWPGTASLYWTSVALKAPRKLGHHVWTVSFSPAELKLAHGAASSRFSFVTVPEPEHSVSVKVLNKKTKAPVAGAQVQLGPYRTVTDEKGAATLRVPKGGFEIVATRAGYEMPSRSLRVSKDVRVVITAEKLPEEDPFAAWTA